MYYRKGRLSFYASLRDHLFWLRIRRRDMAPQGLFMRLGREYH